jgi:hypothetical protein
MSLVGLIKMGLSKVISESVQTHICDMLYIKCGMKQDALSKLFFNIALEYAIGSVQVNQDALKLNGADQLLVFDDYVNIWGGSTHTIKENMSAE